MWSRSDLTVGAASHLHQCSQGNTPQSCPETCLLLNSRLSIPPDPSFEEMVNPIVKYINIFLGIFIIALSSISRQKLTVLFMLASNSWVEVIVLPQPPKQHGTQLCATTPRLSSYSLIWEVLGTEPKIFEMLTTYSTTTELHCWPLDSITLNRSHSNLIPSLAFKPV